MTLGYGCKQKMLLFWGPEEASLHPPLHFGNNIWWAPCCNGQEPVLLTLQTGRGIPCFPVSAVGGELTPLKGKRLLLGVFDQFGWVLIAHS